MNESYRQLGIRVLVLCALVWLASGCAGSVLHMRSIDEPVALAPEKSRIVFMRPKTLGFAIQSSVFVVENGRPELVGIVAAKKKLAHDVEPGEHLFMVVGEAADFMSADLEAGKTYYAEVIPRMGVWKARFGLRAIDHTEVDSGRPEQWARACKWVATQDDSFRWAEQNRTSVEKKLEKYLPRWYEKAEEDRPRLEPGDGS